LDETIISYPSAIIVIEKVHLVVRQAGVGNPPPKLWAKVFLLVLALLGFVLCFFFFATRLVF